MRSRSVAGTTRPIHRILDRMRTAPYSSIIAHWQPINSVRQASQRGGGNGRAQPVDAPVAKDELHHCFVPAAELRVVRLGVADRQGEVRARDPANRRGGFGSINAKITLVVVVGGGGAAAQFAQPDVFFTHQEGVAETVRDLPEPDALAVVLVEPKSAVVEPTVGVVPKTDAVV